MSILNEETERVVTHFWK